MQIPAQYELTREYPSNCDGYVLHQCRADALAPRENDEQMAVKGDAILCQTYHQWVAARSRIAQQIYRAVR